MQDIFTLKTWIPPDYEIDETFSEIKKKGKEFLWFHLFIRQNKLQNTSLHSLLSPFHLETIKLLQIALHNVFPNLYPSMASTTLSQSDSSFKKLQSAIKKENTPINSIQRKKREIDMILYDNTDDEEEHIQSGIHLDPSGKIFSPLSIQALMLKYNACSTSIIHS
ncbi:13139_t:CDS:2 [Ambispora gerdemannii]|uniref:13139_t:CDS:1 n=1 Tax=Ambispora gerdemannii TaxID=144530 RepID=A0A9N9C2A9_9GLOM|nr:13139_t:CDS:2 [Ambispora gerdemannii]